MPGNAHGQILIQTGGQEGKGTLPAILMKNGLSPKTSFHGLIYIHDSVANHIIHQSVAEKAVHSFIQNSSLDTCKLLCFQRFPGTQ